MEFIHFNTRFGIKNTKFSGFIGAAFIVNDSINKTKDILTKKGLAYRIGEETETILNEFNIKCSNLNKVEIKSRLNKTIVINNLIDNIEIVIV